MIPFVVDVNVPIVADGRSDHADDECILACLKILEKIYSDGILLIDDKWLIMKEYVRHLRPRSMPGIGYAFLKWVFENKRNEIKCKCVSLTILNEIDEDILEFPNDPLLKKFDRSDRKYVAVALVSQLNPVVINAVDSHWWKFRKQLSKAGVKVENICPQCIRKTNVYIQKRQ